MKPKEKAKELFDKYAKILTPEEAELKDWDVTLNDGLENEPYVSDDFQIGRAVSAEIYLSYAHANTVSRVSYVERLIRAFNLLRIMEHSSNMSNLDLNKLEQKRMSNKQTPNYFTN